MDWFKQSEEMIRKWSEAQQKFWTAWQQTAGAQDEPATPYAPLFEHWRTLTTQTLELWPGGEDSIAREVAQQFFTSQATMLRFLELAINAWAKLAPQIAQGQNWQDALRIYTDEIRQQFAGAYAEMRQAAQDLNSLWTTYLEGWKHWAQPWMLPLQHIPMGTGRGADLLELTNLYWDTVERTFGSLLQSAGVGLTRELNEKIARGFDCWIDYRRAEAEYRAQLADVWAEAFEQLMLDMAAIVEMGGQPGSLRDLMLMWGEAADRVFIKAFQTEEYVQMQGRFLNAAMAFRSQQREIMEVYLRLYDIPTRSEVDEAHRNIYELRKEIKLLKQQVAELQKPAPHKARKPPQE